MTTGSEEAYNEWGNDEAPAPLSKVTVEEFEALCAELYEQKEVIEQKKDELSVENRKKEALENKIKQHLDAMDRKNYKSKLGTVGIVREITYSLPKTDEDRHAFFDFLKVKGVFENMISVNHKTYNSFIKEQRELAEEDGTILDFSIPGVGAPSIHETIRALKGK